MDLEFAIHCFYHLKNFIGPFNVKDKGKVHLFVWSNKIEVLRNPHFKFETKHKETELKLI